MIPERLSAALHWMLDPDAVIAGVRRALRPGGRFVAGIGALGTVSAVQTALIASTEPSAPPRIRFYSLRSLIGAFQRIFSSSNEKKFSASRRAKRTVRG
jgi:SAM-dependent methyltransferase